MIGLQLYSQSGVSLGQIAGDYLKIEGVFRYASEEPTLINYPAIHTKNNQRYQRQRVYFIDYEAKIGDIINPVSVSLTDDGLSVFYAVTFTGAVKCPCVIYYGYIDEKVYDGI